jgi:two-component system cell cycle sensor histidine kinase/response regulator CckA
MLEDISKRREAELRLKEINSRLTLALDNSRHGIWDWMVKESRIIYDDNCQAILGYEPGELNDFDEEVRNMVHPDDYPALFEAIERCVEFDNSYYDQVYRLRHKSGEWVWVNAVGRVVQRDTEGEAVRMIGTLHDVTARKMAEQELRESEERFRTLADSAPILIWSSGPDGSINYFSKRWLEFRGRTAEQEKNRGWVAGVHPDDRELGRDIYLSSFKARQTFQSEFRLKRHDDEYRWMLGTGAPRYSPDGTFLGYIGTCLDITDQRSLQEQLYESQKLESLGRLAGGIAHDFNNLLTAIIGYSDLALSRTSESEDTHKFLTNVRNAGERAAELTSQLLMYARRQMVQFTTLDINDVILKMDPFLRRSIGESYEFVVNPSPDIWQVRSNAAQIEQVLMNLVVNARDAMPDGGRILIETANIVLDTDYAVAHFDVVAGEYVMLAVSDNGQGMTREVQERIFEPFFTTKEVGKGTGLGLATCYGIVRQSGGNIWVYSEPGQGTTFKIYLPRVKGGTVSESRPAAKKLPKGKETILLVDDEPLVRDIGARILREHGYQVMEASNGEDALRVEAESNLPIDMLLCDVVMPQMGGKELAQRMLAMYPDLKVLYTSGYTQNVNLHEGILEPGLDLLVKPFSSSGLLEAVRTTLDRE